ncbi:hypothetical protein BH11ARM2_BH11ARM2_29010 [soil metagenome]
MLLEVIGVNLAFQLGFGVRLPTLEMTCGFETRPDIGRSVMV